MPALPPYLIEPIWQQFSALLPEREVDHPLGCHRRRISDRVVFDKLVQVLVFGCAYHRIADESCSATTLCERRDEWIELGVIDALREAFLSTTTSDPPILEFYIVPNNILNPERLSNLLEPERHPPSAWFYPF